MNRAFSVVRTIEDIAREVSIDTSLKHEPADRRVVRKGGADWVIDARTYQIAVLSGLLAAGVIWRQFPVDATHVALVIANVLAAQWVCTRLCTKLPYDPRSPLITGLSLCLLLRVDDPALAVLAGWLAVLSKYFLRYRGKHVFNPANFALSAVLIASPRAWISPGQWGDSVVFAFALACAGLVVVHRALRWDITLAFLAFFGAGLFGRAMWLGDPWQIPSHQAANGALLLFAFFMLSDPKTTPDARPARLVFALWVACLAYLFRFHFFEPNGLIYSLTLGSLLVPVLDHLWPTVRYAWGARRAPSVPRKTPPLSTSKEPSS